VAVVAFAYLEAGDPITGTGYELSVIAAAIIGGTALSGGQGSVFGALIGALIISTITAGLIQFGLTQDWAQFATGTAIIAAVALDTLLKRRRQRAAERLGLQRATHVPGAEPDQLEPSASAPRQAPADTAKLPDIAQP
jgi:ribose transport system permease protein